MHLLTMLNDRKLLWMLSPAKFNLVLGWCGSLPQKKVEGNEFKALKTHITHIK